MYDEPHVWLVNPHAESNSGHHNLKCKDNENQDMKSSRYTRSEVMPPLATAMDFIYGNPGQLSCLSHKEASVASCETAFRHEPTSRVPVGARKGNRSSCVKSIRLEKAVKTLCSMNLLLLTSFNQQQLFELQSAEIGMGLTGFGVFFLFFGMILFFDKALLAIGNVLFVAGLAFVIGLERTFRFFFQKHKVKATGFFLGGVFIVLIGWPLIGMPAELVGK
ncbi:Vesicle transport protein GOT1B, partial [Ophiophagus hannah]